jgi:hypothetical protein
MIPGTITEMGKMSEVATGRIRVSYCLGNDLEGFREMGQ